jgi:MoaA/NifB/PqqE/SkfB family radical SAM enzyme
MSDARDIYAATKALRHLDILAGARAVRPVRPAHIHFSVSDACNQGCAYCAYRDPTHTASERFLPAAGGVPHRMIATAKAMEILGDCAAMGCKAVQFTGGGEPTTHPDLAGMMARCRALGLSYAVVTNGQLVERKGLVDDLASAAWCRFSVDTHDPALYASLRGTSTAALAEVCAAIRAVVARRDAMDTGCIIGLGIIVGPETYSTIWQTVEMARDLGVDNVSLAPEVGASGAARFAGIEETVLAACQLAEGFSDSGFAVYNRVPSRLAELRAGRPAFQRCGIQHFTPYIGSDAVVYRCCALSYNGRGVIADLSATTFRDAWTAQETATALAAFDPAGCVQCPFTRQNAVLDFVLRSEEPVHVDFV